MSNVDFPTRTAGDLTLPGGDTVWVSTLNTLLKEQADARARRYAQNECRGLLKGGADYAAVLAEIRGFDAEKQAGYLAQGEYWTIRQEALGKFAAPEEPEQGDLEPEAYAKACVKWEEECKSASEKRDKFEQTRFDAEVKRGVALTEKVRVERCVTAYFAREFGAHFVKRLNVETLYRAVRLSDDHTSRYFSCVEAVEDADDDVLQALMKFYFEDLDTVKVSDIPT